MTKQPSIKKESFFGLLAGTGLGKMGGASLFLVATVMLVINEGNFKKNKDAILEAASVVVHVDDLSTLDPEREGLLIHGTAQTQTDEWVSDPLFEISKNAVKLIREVWYYQWDEDEETEEWTDSDGDTHSTTTYTYERRWCPQPVDSDKFRYTKGHENSLLAEVYDMEKYAELVYWGAYELPLFLKQAVDSTLPVSIQLSQSVKEKWEKTLAQTVRKQTKTTLMGLASEYLHMDDNAIYMGANPKQPKVGDLRIQLRYIPPGRDLSIIAQVEGSSFVKYQAKNGRSFHSVYNGIRAEAAMIADEHKNNANNLWTMRLTLFCCLILALRCTLEWLPRLFSRIPALGNVLHAGVRMICFVLALVWSIFVIAAAWLFYRPLTSLILFGVALLLIWLLQSRGKRKDAKIKNSLMFDTL